MVFRHVAVVDVRSGTILRDRTVAVRGDKILAVLSGSASLHGTKVVEARGKYMIPGLWDCHMHNDSVNNTREFFFPLYIANGVTGVRNMCGDVFPRDDVKDGVPIEALRRLQKEVSEGKAVGPRMVLGSVIVDGTSTNYKG
ncbi:MAG TPA: hypothetical protein VG944_11410, partial [Fimbriimonas sp.]|nr:hypothetical protein [Fimbriimonas sp.]